MSLTITNKGDRSAIPDSKLGDLCQGQWFVEPNDIVSIDPLVLSSDAVIYIKICNDDLASTCYAADRFVDTRENVESHQLFAKNILMAFPNHKLVTMIDVAITTDNIELAE